ncbi:MAG TPA: glycosyltransferase family 87 protein, partial [Chloroflexia bacterium]|nr:glycosyltransferase family 87 protein [Chloroflexia bacterium]
PPYVYPPTLAVLVAPLSFLPANTATMLWKLAQHVCLLISGGLLVSLVPPRARAMLVAIFCLGLLTAPVHDEIMTGESNSLVFVLVVAAVWLVSRQEKAERKDPYHITVIIAGLLLGLAISIKVLPVLVVAYFAWKGPRRVAAWAAAGFFGTQLLTLALAPATMRYWLEVFPGLFGQAFPYPDNQSINAFLARALLATDPNLPPMQIAQGEPVRGAVTWLANLAVAGTAAFLLWKSGHIDTGEEHDQRRVRLLLEVGLVLLTTHLVSGSTWLHHLVALAVPVAGLVGTWGLRGRAGIPGQLTLFGVAGALSAFALLLRSPYDWLISAAELAPAGPLLALLASSTAMWVVIGLWIIVGRVLTDKRSFADVQATQAAHAGWQHNRP